MVAFVGVAARSASRRGRVRAAPSVCGSSGAASDSEAALLARFGIGSLLDAAVESGSASPPSGAEGRAADVCDSTFRRLHCAREAVPEAAAAWLDAFGSGEVCGRLRAATCSTTGAAEAEAAGRDAVAAGARGSCGRVRTADAAGCGAALFAPFGIVALLEAAVDSGSGGPTSRPEGRAAGE